ncbi:MAG: DNA/RNA non-specific endonuclease [Chitinophagales bacterium]
MKLFVLRLSILLVLAGCSKNHDIASSADNDNLLLGNPTNAKTNTAYPDNYLKDNIYYKIAYSNSRSEPIWVSWHLQSEDLGSTARQNDFRADGTLPATWYLVQNTSYVNSGFDRGHNCPSADRTQTVVANSSTFLMSNMIPQAPNLNQGPWADLENFIRDSLVGLSNEAYIMMGNYGAGGTGSNGAASVIDNGNVTVPAEVYKIIVILPKGNNDLSRINSNTTVLAVRMPNNNNLYTTTTAGKKVWRNYITTINAIEQEALAYGLTLTFLTNVADNVRPVLKAKLYQ